MMSAKLVFRMVLAALAILSYLPAAPGKAVALDAATYSTGWIPLPRDAGFFVARDLGWYKAAGLDIKIVRGFGGSAVAKDVAAGTIELGHADPRSVIKIRNQGGDLKGLGVIHAKNVYAIYSLKGNGITKPKDLEGRRLGAPVGETVFVNLPALASANNVDIAKIKHIPMSPQAMVSSLATGKVDAITLFTVSYPIVEGAVGKHGKEPVVIPYADFGVDVYPIGIVAREKTIRERRRLVDRFIKASMKGLAWSVENPKGAIDIFLKSAPTTNRKVAEAIWRLTVEHLLTPESKTLGIGQMTLEKWERTLAVVKQTSEETINVKAADLYTNEFLPKLFPKAP